MIRRFPPCFLSLALLSSACSDDNSSESDPPTDGPVDEPASDPESTEHDGPAPVLEVIGRAEYVTGGDVLVRYSGEKPAFTADGAALSSESRGGGVYLVAGLAEGASTIAAGGTSIDVVNYPITGPVFSGTHQDKLFCALDTFGLTPTGDDDCSAETVVRYGYISEEGFVETDDVSADSTVVRLEMGTINRGIYSIAVADPSYGAEPIPQGKDLIYTFGGGCGNGHTQSPGIVAGGTVLDESALAAGYVVATSTFNIFQAHCNDVLSAETLLMTQERVNEVAGPINLTIGRGGSGGAIQQYSIVQNYPDLLDAVHASVSFPDSVSISGGVTDCGLLIAYYDSSEGEALTSEQRLAINGHGSVQFCRAWAALFLPSVYADRGCDGAVPVEEIYNADTNPTGIRCTLQDSVSNLFGVDENGFGRRPLDNAGVEYGRNALDDGVITVDQFLDLNEELGGYDLDGNIIGERTVADADLIEHAYATGRVLRGDSGVLDIPIIDVDLYSDLGYDIHDRFRLFTIRARMSGSDETPPGNRVIWTRGGSGLLTLVGGGDDGGPIVDEGEGSVPSPTDIADVLVEWATTGERPDGVADDCIVDDVRIVGDDAFDAGQPCAEAYPHFGDPRTAAGQDLVNDILKCTTKAPDAADYAAEFINGQWDRLLSIFAEGVCDYTVPGVGQVPLQGTWLEY
jgi:hypothetical protein